MSEDNDGSVVEAGPVSVDVPLPDRPLVAGDIVYFSVNCNDFNGYIMSEGVVDNRIQTMWFPEGSDELPIKFTQCLFRLYKSGGGGGGL